MLHSSEIINTMRENNDRIMELEGTVRQLRNAYRGCTIQDIKTRVDEFKENKEQESKCYSEIEYRKILRGILHDNARRAFFAETMPVVLEVFKKYEGKVIGPKTNDKIYKEVVEKTGHGFYFDKSWRSNLVLSYRGVPFRHDDFTIYLKDGSKKMFDDNNRLIVWPLEDYILYNCGEYVEDPEAQATKIQESFDELKRIEENFRNACSEFNKLIPSNIEYRNPGNFKSYLFSAL